MAKRSVARSKGRKSKKRDDGLVSEAQRRQIHFRLIGQGAFQRPANRLVDIRDPAKTIASCRQVLGFLYHVERPLEDEELVAGRDRIHALVWDALTCVEHDLTGLWDKHGRDEEVRS